MAELERLSSKVSLSQPIKEKAAVIYRKALDKGLVRGRSINAISAAALYAACRKSGSPKALREVAEASLVDKKDVARCYRLLLQELDFHMPISDPLTYVSKIAEKNGVSGKTQGAAIVILRTARQQRFSAGKDPMGMAAAAIYIACVQNNEKITQKDIAEAAGVTEVTVRNRYKALKIQLKLKTPELRACF
jgi:transcription initiation factor TFIIB